MRARTLLGSGILAFAAVTTAVTTTATPAGAGTASASTYAIKITGTSSNNQFTITGTLSTRATVTKATTNGVNPFEVCLKAGSPAARPTTGAIQYGTNSACFPSAGANVDTSQVRGSTSSVSIVPDGRLQATLLNQWNARGGVAVCVYAPVNGSITLRFSGTKVTGTVDLEGFGGSSCGRSSYRARITGSRK